MVGASAQAALAATHTAVPASMRGRRPKRSDNGPMTSCPNAKPTMKVVNVSWIVAALVPNWAAIDGNADRYMSIDNGATAVSKPSTPSQLGGSAVTVWVW